MSSHHNSTVSVSNHRYLDMMTVRPSQGARLTATSSIPAFNPSSTLAGTGMSSVRNSSPGAHLGSSSSSGKGPSTMPAAHLTAQTHALGSAPLTTLRRSSPSHNSLLIEPILLPNLQHVLVDNPQDLEESCLFYPNGHKNRNIRREIESSVVKHHILENSKMKPTVVKNKFRVIPEDPYADAKGPPLYYGKKRDKETEDLLRSVREKEKKIVSTVQVRI